jgi:hypothetical protein
MQEVHEQPRHAIGFVGAEQSAVDEGERGLVAGGTDHDVELLAMAVAEDDDGSIEASHVAGRPDGT